jgi:hypothetical protein
MSNLEELTLFISVIRLESTYIDGNQLYNEIVVHMPRLNQFIFSISTLVFNVERRINLPSNNDIQHSFIERGIQQVGSYVNHPLLITGECRIYSIPYQFDTFLYLTNAYSSDTFNKVQCLLMADREPFEHQLFKIIAQHFPLFSGTSS